MAKTIEQCFDTLLNWIKPLTTEHNKAASHKESVRSCMINNFGCNLFFETGSFSNGTGVRHFSDTDYFARCPAGNFYNDATYTLRLVKEALQRTFSTTPGIVVKNPAIRIPFGSFASERLELTPVYYGGIINTSVGNKYFYNIPNYDGEWMQSSPGAHTEYVNREDRRLKGRLKPLIQLVKAWKFYNQIPIYSFYLELRVTKYAESQGSIIYDIDLKNIIKFLYDNDLPSIQDTMGISGLISACKTTAKKNIALFKLATGCTRAIKAYNARSTDTDISVYWWKMFFNDQFPAR